MERRKQRWKGENRWKRNRRCSSDIRQKKKILYKGDKIELSLLFTA
jgi:hypothetical protein